MFKNCQLDETWPSFTNLPQNLVHFSILITHKMFHCSWNKTLNHILSIFYHVNTANNHLNNATWPNLWMFILPLYFYSYLIFLPFFSNCDHKLSYETWKNMLLTKRLLLNDFSLSLSLHLLFVCVSSYSAQQIPPFNPRCDMTVSNC